MSLISSGQDSCNKTCDDSEIRLRAKKYLEKTIKEFKSKKTIYVGRKEIEIDLALLSESFEMTDDVSSEIVQVMEQVEDLQI